MIDHHIQKIKPAHLKGLHAFSSDQNSTENSPTKGYESAKDEEEVKGT